MCRGSPGPLHRQRGSPGTAGLVPPNPREVRLSHRRAVVLQGKTHKRPPPPPEGRSVPKDTLEMG